MRILFICLLSLGLSACSSTHNEQRYLSSQEVQPISIPHGLSSSSIKNEYPLPRVKPNKNEKVPSLFPPE